MRLAAALCAALLGAGFLLSPAAPSAQGHVEHVDLGDLPVLQFDPQVAVLVPGASVEKSLNTTLNGRIAWWTVILCHCEAHRVLFTIDGPPGAAGEQFLIAPPTYHHYALYWVHWEGLTNLTWTNEGNKTVVIEFRAGVWPADAPPSAPAAGAGPLPPEAPALAAGAGALAACALWASRARPSGAPPRARRGALRPPPPAGPGALAVAALALALLAALAAPMASEQAAAAGFGPPPSTTRAAPPPGANLTVVKIQSPAANATAHDTLAVSGTAFVNETEAARIGMDVSLEAVFLSFNFGPLLPADGVANWSYAWNTTPFDNGVVWVGAAAVDSTGNYTYDWVKVDVENGAHPVALASASPTRGYAPLAVNFTGSATDADGTIAGFSWRFGDGASAVGAAVGHTFALPGLYAVTLTAVDDRGTQGRALLNITVLDPAGRPSCAPHALIQSGPDALTVTLFGEAFDDGSIAGVDWQFGDGSSGSGFNLTHTYLAGGNYTVVMSARDNEGNVGSALLNITVPDPLRERTDFPNLRSGPSPPDLRGLLEVYTAAPGGKRVSVILTPLRPGDTIEWRFVACACAGLQNLSFYVEAPDGAKLLPVAVASAGALVVAWNALTVNASGVYALVWENNGPGDVEIGYTVRTTAQERAAPPSQGLSAATAASLGLFAGAAGFALVGVRRRRPASAARPPAARHRRGGG